MHMKRWRHCEMTIPINISCKKSNIPQNFGALLATMMTEQKDSPLPAQLSWCHRYYSQLVCLYPHKGTQSLMFPAFDNLGSSHSGVALDSARLTPITENIDHLLRQCRWVGSGPGRADKACVAQHTSAKRAVIQNIIMNQTGCMDHFCDLRQPPMPVSDISAPKTRYYNSILVTQSCARWKGFVCNTGI